ncbi:MAG: FAD-dependent tricarballylate dehydrogenase TcuA [Rhodobacteraceae bacterium]|nr:FAD-dependent tricarballylate dehydrogenase TcuA [Paracoccaceae bacterium]
MTADKSSLAPVCVRRVCDKVWDVIVVGGGNAAICAAMQAAESKADVLILESAPITMRGGNSRHTRNIRCMHDGENPPLTGQYSEAEFLQDLLQVSDGNTDRELAVSVIRRSADCLQWMKQRGVLFQPALSGTLSLQRTNAFFLGGGKALLNTYFQTANRFGISVLYEAEVCHIRLSDNSFTGVEAMIGGKSVIIKGRSAVLASGGFQADLDWLEKAWGPPARNFLVRGTPQNRGKVLRDMMNQGAVTIGDASQCHAVAIDGRAPKFDGGIVTRIDCIPFSITVNQYAERFYDEGEDLWPKRYAIWGRLVAVQPGQQAFAIIDSKSFGLFVPSAFPPIEADNIQTLAEQIGLSGEKLTRTVQEFNAACRSGPFDPNALDGLATVGLGLPKSNWARPINEPPFRAYMLRPGVTFTYLGLQVDRLARVQGQAGPYENIWAAGEIMAGSVLRQGYLAGFGMTIGTVFGRIAGEEAARHVL